MVKEFDGGGAKPIHFPYIICHFSFFIGYDWLLPMSQPKDDRMKNDK